MKKVIFDITEMSDSKEIYGQRPNPFFAVFIYCLLAIFVAALIYCCFGKIEVVAIASGLVRPNDDVSTVSGLLSGRVTDIFYANGQIVAKGEKLLCIDTSEMQISLSSLEKLQDDYENQIVMLDKFLEGIKKNKNPFSADMDSEEYSYYVQFRDYELSLQNSQESIEYDISTADLNVSAMKEKIADLKEQISGWKAYEKSVKKNENRASDYPEYESMYLLYVTALQALEAEYETQKEKIEQDATSGNNAYYLEYYQTQLTEYSYLISSIEGEASVFPEGHDSVCKHLYDDYVNNLAEYQRAYEHAEETYQYYLDSIANPEANGIGNAELDYQIASAKAQMESAEAAVGSYMTKMLAEYKQAQKDLQMKLDELNMSSSSPADKEALLAELEKSYQNSKEQKYYQTITQIDSTLQSLQAELGTAQSSLKTYEIADEMYKKNVDENGTPLPLSLAAVEQIASVLSSRETLSTKLEEIDTQIQQAEAQIAEGTIFAKQAGVVNTVTTLTTGDTLTSGTVIATIIPFNESEYKVQLYVSNADIANIEVGDRIKYNVMALPSNQYGFVDGTVTNISSDTLVQNGEYSGYYLVEGNIDCAELSDEDGNSGSISIGMQVEAKIVTQEKIIIRYLLEKINIF